jgi:prophage DNA circulation protein
MSTTADFALAAQGLAGAVLAASVRPSDAIRLLADLAAVVPVATDATTADMAAMRSATGDLLRRAAVVALARASAMYQPTSFDDAAAVRVLVCDLIDREVTIAGDQMQDATFAAFRALRAAVALDLATRGAGLSSVATVASGAVPAPVLAQRLYRDPVRADELVTQAAPVHPAFMPAQFKALSS